MSFLIICCPGSLQVKLLVLAITTLGNGSAKSLTASQSRWAPIFTPHLHT
ncbi:MAG: hypothetical protein KGD68_15970 [Candidatus Lokiarchaeota archaeon]|nr:hypothetical protein [Candidatus Lokiarchaeota archaeon]